MRYSEELTLEICELLKKGNTKTSIMDYLSIPSSTWYDWEKKSEFSEAIKKAESEAIIRVEQKLQNVAERGTNPTLIMFYLQNRRPETWQDKRHHEHSGEFQPLEVIIKKNGDESDRTP